MVEGAPLFRGARSHAVRLSAERESRNIRPETTGETRVNFLSDSRDSTLFVALVNAWAGSNIDLQARLGGR